MRSLRSSYRGNNSSRSFFGRLLSQICVLISCIRQECIFVGVEARVDSIGDIMFKKVLGSRGQKLGNSRMASSAALTKGNIAQQPRKMDTDWNYATGRKGIASKKTATGSAAMKQLRGAASTAGQSRYAKHLNNFGPPPSNWGPSGRVVSNALANGGCSP
eukprot:GSA25T00007289001.1